MAGLTIIGQPAAKAGPAFRVIIAAFPLFSKPFYEAGRINDLARGFRQWFPLLSGHQHSEIVEVGVVKSNLTDEYISSRKIG